MGTNYVESSLKRFLKRKVKVTLGLIVAFMITGTVGFAEEITGSVVEGKGKWVSPNEWLEGIGTEKELENIDKTFEIDTDKAISIKTENGVLTISYPEDKKVEISSTEISNKVLENVNNALLLGKNTSDIEKLNLNLTNDNGSYSQGFSYVNNTKDTFKSLNHNQISVIEKGKTHNKSVFAFKMNESNVYYAGQYAENDGIIVNKGIIEVKKDGTDATHMFGQAAFGGTAYNYGIIKNQDQQGQRIQNGIGYNYGIIANKGNLGQALFDDGAVYNYGVIVNKGTQGQSGAVLYNYGIIANNGTQGQNSPEAYNYGIIANNGIRGQYGDIKSRDAKLINYGIIKNNGYGGQYLNNSGQKLGRGELINYGLIANNGFQGQCIVSPDKENGSKIENYGIIANKGIQGQSISKNVKGYNYGIIANNNDNKKEANIVSYGDGFNYGVIVNKNGYGTAGNVENNGIIFVTETGLASMHQIASMKNNKANNGVTIIKNETGKGVDNKDIKDYGIEISAKPNEKIAISKVGENMFVATNQDDTVVTKDNKFNMTTGELAENKNLFVDRYTANKLTETVELKNDTLKGNHITTIVGKVEENEDTSDTPVLTKKGDLTLNNSSIVGYFEKNGTLLEINGNLTLEGDSVINAIAGNEYTGHNGTVDVTAVKLTDGGVLEIGENSKVLGAVKGNGTLIYENSEGLHSNTQEVDSLLVRTTTGKTTDVSFANVTLKDSKIDIENSGKFIINNQSDEKIEDKETSTSITLANNINIEKGIDGSSSAYGIELILGDGQSSSDGTITIGKKDDDHKKEDVYGIALGAGDDTVVIQNKADIAGAIDGADGNDTVILKNLTENHDTFDYKLANVEVLDLNNQTWEIGKTSMIYFNDDNPGKTTEIKNGTLKGDLTFDINEIQNNAIFENKDAVSIILDNSIFNTADNKGYLQLGIGKGSELEAGAEYEVDSFNKVQEEYVKVSAIFNRTAENMLTVKTAEEIGVDSDYSDLYDEMLDNAGNNEEIRDVLNNSDAESIASAINGKGVLGETLATTGYKITRDISNSFMSAVNEWDKKANKGEWLANAKYINSDVEYDGANSVKGYDSDINSMIGMIEYGVSDRTAYGIALGGGETEINVDGAGQLEGDNYYIGAYAKHSVNGFDLVGNLGYTISELEVNGEGSADSSAITLGAYVKRNIALTDTVRLEPNAAFTYDYIMQDNAEGSGVKVDNKDIHVFEAAAGMNIVKSFALEKGLFEMKAGVKYSMADVNRNEETVISTFGVNGINLGSPDIDKARGTAHIGFDFEHTTGFGVNGKYETMWSDSGDDSRITAGISYRF